MHTTLLDSRSVAAAHAERTAALTAAWRRPDRPHRDLGRLLGPLAALLHRRPAAAR